MLAVSSPEHRRHDPVHEVAFGREVPLNESPARADLIEAALRDDPGFEVVPPAEHGLAPIEAVHDPEMVAYLAHAWEDWWRESGEREAIPDTYRNLALREGMGPGRVPRGAAGRLAYYSFDTATPMVEGTYAAARAAVDVALTALDHVLAGNRNAYGLCRPPGHHAPRAAFGGFCFFNNAAVAAQAAVERGAARVTVLDVDYHHGNGTQQIFYDRGDVQYVSLHADPDRAYPYLTGFAEETGAAKGSGTTTNVPLGRGCGQEDYLALLGQALDEVERFDPEVLVVSLGVDTHRDDPIGDLGLTTDAFEPIGRAVAGLVRPTVVLQEGGYDLASLTANVVGFLRGLEAR